MSEHNERQLFRALAEIDDLREESKEAYLAGYELAHGFKLTDREKEVLIRVHYKEWRK